MQDVRDQQIYETIVDELNWDDGVCALDICVQVRGGRVYLSGSTPDVEQRLRAEAIARLMPGVVEVYSELTVESRLTGRDTVTLAGRIHAVLAGLGCVDPEAIQVRIEGGWVKLSGLVGTDEQRQRLVWSLQKMLGIREVAEALTVSSALPV